MDEKSKQHEEKMEKFKHKMNQSTKMLEEECAVLKREKVAIEKMRQGAESDLETLRHELATATAAVIEADRRREASETTLADMQAKMGDVLAALEDMSTRFAQMKIERDALLASRDSDETTTVALQKRIAALEAELEEARSGWEEEKRGRKMMSRSGDCPMEPKEEPLDLLSTRSPFSVKDEPVDNLNQMMSRSGDFNMEPKEEPLDLLSTQSPFSVKDEPVDNLNQAANKLHPSPSPVKDEPLNDLDDGNQVPISSLPYPMEPKEEPFDDSQSMPIDNQIQWGDFCEAETESPSVNVVSAAAAANVPFLYSLSHPSVSFLAVADRDKSVYLNNGLFNYSSLFNTSIIDSQFANVGRRQARFDPSTPLTERNDLINKKDEKWVLYEIEKNGQMTFLATLQGTFTIGRKTSNMLALKGENTISGQHAYLEHIVDKVTIVDHSANGSCINGVKLARGSSSILKSGDVLQFGECARRFILEKTRIHDVEGLQRQADKFVDTDSIEGRVYVDSDWDGGSCSLRLTVTNNTSVPIYDVRVQAAVTKAFSISLFPASSSSSPFSQKMTVRRVASDGKLRMRFLVSFVIDGQSRKIEAVCSTFNGLS